MSANRAKNTSPELLLRQLLYHSGYRGYRLHRSIRFPSWIGGVAEGRGGRSVRPDISFNPLLLLCDFAGKLLSP